MKTFSPFIVAGIFATSLGCVNPEVDVQIAKMDSLHQEIENVESKMNEIDSAEVRRRYREQIEKINTIQQTFDSIPRKVAYIINNYTSYKKGYKTWSSKIDIFYTEARLRKNQLNDLKQDIDNDLLELEDLKKYVHNESQHINSLVKVVHEMKFGLESVDTLFLKSEAKIDSIINSATETEQP